MRVLGFINEPPKLHVWCNICEEWRDRENRPHTTSGHENFINGNMPLMENNHCAMVALTREDVIVGRQNSITMSTKKYAKVANATDNATINNNNGDNENATNDITINNGDNANATENTTINNGGNANGIINNGDNANTTDNATINNNNGGNANATINNGDNANATENTTINNGGNANATENATINNGSNVTNKSVLSKIINLNKVIGELFLLMLDDDNDPSNTTMTNDNAVASASKKRKNRS